MNNDHDWKTHRKLNEMQSLYKLKQFSYLYIPEKDINVDKNFMLHKHLIQMWLLFESKSGQANSITIYTSKGRILSVEKKYNVNR